MRACQLRESPFIKAGRVVSRFDYDDVYVAEMPANLENFSKKRSWRVVVGAILAHIGVSQADFCLANKVVCARVGACV